MEYATRLSALAARLQKDLVVIMRVYIEKPRTTVGWKGYVHDPDLTQSVASQALDRGLYASRKIMLSVASLGLPVATEMLSPLIVPFLDDLVSLGVIGARTTESQTHRELASDVAFPVGFKNGTDGGLRVAFDAIKAAARPHSLLGVNDGGSLLQRVSTGNKNTFVVLRGGKDGPNYSPEHVQKTRAQMMDAALPPAIMVDCSHGNSNKDYRNQAIVARSVGDQILAGAEITGVMIESNINGGESFTESQRRACPRQLRTKTDQAQIAGRQDIPIDGKECLKYGVSVTDGCVSWEETEDILEKLAAAVRGRRLLRAKPAGFMAVDLGRQSFTDVGNVRDSFRSRRLSAQTRVMG